MKVRNTSILRLIIAGLAITMLAIALACASEEPEPTSPPATAPTPTTSAAATPLTVDAQPTATPVDVMEMDLTWMDRYLQSPGYDPAWGEPVKGGTYIFGAQGDSTTFNATGQGCCYTHGCFRGLPVNTLFRIDAWQGDLTAIEGDLVESWDVSEDGKTITMKLYEGVMFHEKMTEESVVPAEFNGGKILGDEFVCEDAKATYDRFVSPPEWETGYPLNRGAVYLGHLESTSCPDGPRGYTFVMHFDRTMAKTMGILAGHSASIQDKDFIAWVNDFGEREGRSFGDTELPANFYSMHGTGPFVPVDINVSVSTTFDANPNYWREGLPLIDKYHNVVIKDPGSRFTALATGKVHYYGEGSYGFTSGQAEQALRDFQDTIVVNDQLNHWARTVYFGARAPWDDLRVRRAIHLALDREEWKAFRRVKVGDSSIEGTQLAQTMAPGTFYAPTQEEIATWPGYRQPKDEDIAEANRLMDEVFGAGNRPTAKCSGRTETVSNVDGCLWVMDQLGKNLGMDVASDFRETAAVTPITNSGNFDFSVGSFTSSVIGDPDDRLYDSYIREFLPVGREASIGARWEEQPQVMAEVEELIRAQTLELDPLKRKELIRELDMKILNEVSQYVVMGWTNIFPSWRVELKGWRGYDLYSNTKYVMHERMWIADN